VNSPRLVLWSWRDNPSTAARIRGRKLTTDAEKRPLNLRDGLASAAGTITTAMPLYPEAR